MTKEQNATITFSFIALMCGHAGQYYVICVSANAKSNKNLPDRHHWKISTQQELEWTVWLAALPTQRNLPTNERKNDRPATFKLTILRSHCFTRLHWCQIGGEIQKPPINGGCMTPVWNSFRCSIASSSSSPSSLLSRAHFRRNLAPVQFIGGLWFYYAI